MTIYCPKRNQEREFPPKTWFIYIVIAGLVGEMLKPLFRRRDSCGFRFTDTLAARSKTGG